MAKVLDPSFPSERRENSPLGDFNLYTILKSEEEAFARAVEKQTKTNVAKEPDTFSEWLDNDDKVIDSDSEEDTTELFCNTVEMIGKAFIATFPKILEAVADILFESFEKE